MDVTSPGLGFHICKMGPITQGDQGGTGGQLLEGWSCTPPCPHASPASGRFPPLLLAENMARGDSPGAFKLLDECSI